MGEPMALRWGKIREGMAWSEERAFIYLQAEAGTQFDPDVVRGFVELYRTGQLIAPAAFRSR